MRMTLQKGQKSVTVQSITNTILTRHDLYSRLNTSAGRQGTSSTARFPSCTQRLWWQAHSAALCKQSLSLLQWLDCQVLLAYFQPHSVSVQDYIRTAHLINDKLLITHQQRPLTARILGVSAALHQVAVLEPKMSFSAPKSTIQKINKETSKQQTHLQVNSPSLCPKEDECRMEDAALNLPLFLSLRWSTSRTVLIDRLFMTLPGVT